MVSRIAVAVAVSFGMFYFYPYLRTIISTLYTLAQTLNPNMTYLENTFFQIMPIFVLGVIVYWAIMKVIGKIEGDKV